jgi:M6 family metalloprotease-like protein
MTREKPPGTTLVCSIITVLILFTLVIPTKSYGVPAYDGLFELKQPSGKTFEARKRGDEWYNWVETKDGYGIYKNEKTGNWEYYLPSTSDVRNRIGVKAKSPQQQAVVGEVDPSSLGIPKGLKPPEIPRKEKKLFNLESDFFRQREIGAKAAVSGKIPLLVICVDYEDTPATYPVEQIQPLAFGASNSVSDYYSDVSYSASTFSPATESHGTSNDGVIGWLRLSGNHPNTGSNTGDENGKIAEESIIAADPYIDYSFYDANNDGYVESTELSIIIMVAGYEASCSSSSPSVWAHASSGYLNVTVDGKTIYQYVEMGEKHGDHLATFGVMAHELGHLAFYLPDLYDTDTSNGDSNGIGSFCLMAGGGWGAATGAYAGSSPTHLCAWSKEYLSWGTVNTIASSQTISFPKADGNSTSVFRMNTSDSNQYFLIENRQFSGYDIGFQGSTGTSGHGGLVIYHIDSLSYSNSLEDDKMVDIEEANEGSLGYSMLDTKEYSAHTNMFFFSGNNTSFTDTTTPNSRLKNGNSTNISITNISTYGDNMTASVIRPPTAKTGSVTNMTSNSATLNGTVNAYGYTTTVWFEYGITSGTYSNTTTTQTVSGSTDTTVSIDISSLSENTTYYYRIVAQNSAGTVYGTENNFMLITVTTKIAAGARHSLALKSNGTVWAWGNNSDGQLGDETTTNRTIPVQASNLNAITVIDGGASHSIALRYDGTVWTWGANWDGQLGDGTNTRKTTPVQISGLGDIISIACGMYHSIALKSDGTVWAFGRNDYGQLGDGTNVYRNKPVQVSSLSDVIAITGGDYHCLALKSDGIVWAWGNNESGQLGDGTTTNRNTPVQVSSFSNVAAIARGWVHSLALKSDGTAWAWGANGSGQLGDGTTINKTSPVKISNLNNVIDIAGGGGYTIALESDGTVWTCGEYGWDYYENNGGAYWSYYYRTTPDYVAGINDVVAVAGGWQHIVVLKQDGTVWTWGVNWYGQLGDGTTTDRDTPVQVDINLGKTADVIVPAGSININSGDAYTNSTAVTLNLSASDGTGVTGYYLSTNSTTPLTSDSGWTSVTSTTSYSTSVSYTLSSGDGIKTVYVWYKDAAGNISNAVSDSITLDATSPTVIITSPTSDSTYSTTNSTIDLSGTASDSTSGVNSVTWSNDRGGSGTAGGTTTWSISGISLLVGYNTIAVTVSDNAGNTAIDTIKVTYTVPTPTPTPTPTATPIATVTKTPTATATATATPVSCDVATAITSSPSAVTVTKGDSTEVSVTVTGADGCAVVDDKVKATTNDTSIATVSPSKLKTNANGQATFTITGKKKGSAKVTFKEKTANLKTKVSVKVVK